MQMRMYLSWPVLSTVHASVRLDDMDMQPYNYLRAGYNRGFGK